MIITHKLLYWTDLADHISIARTVFGTVKVISDGSEWDIYLYSPLSDTGELLKSTIRRVYGAATSREEAKEKALAYVQEETARYLPLFIQFQSN